MCEGQSARVILWMSVGTIFDRTVPGFGVILQAFLMTCSDDEKVLDKLRDA